MDPISDKGTAEETVEREQILAALNCAVAEAVTFFARTDEALRDGHQSAREVLAHLVYWHREYVGITRALASGARPKLKMGTLSELNAAAAREFKDLTMAELIQKYADLQMDLEVALRSLPDWSLAFPVKYGSRIRNVADRLLAIEAHIRGHVNRLQRAERRGEAWIQAYYPDSIEVGGEE